MQHKNLLSEQEICILSSEALALRSTETGLFVCMWIISSLFNKAFKPVVIFNYDALLLATMGMKHMLKIKCFSEWGWDYAGAEG